jgi:hypothetical protein
MAEIVRCPYCVLADNFRPMLPKPEGLFVCQKCGHAVVLGNREFKCFCQKCQELKMRRRCAVVEIANLSDAVGYPCAKRASQQWRACEGRVLARPLFSYLRDFRVSEISL